jgi:hypothetical protein
LITNKTAVLLVARSCPINAARSPSLIARSNKLDDRIGANANSPPTMAHRPRPAAAPSAAG